MHALLRATVATIVAVTAACSSAVPDAMPAPTAVESPSVPSPTSTAEVEGVLTERSCADFRDQAEAQAYYLESGGPTNDLHGLDPDGDGRACEGLTGAEATPQPTATAAATVTRTPARPPAHPQGTPHMQNSSSGPVESGESDSGSTHNQQCSPKCTAH